MKYMTPKAIAAFETALEMRANGKTGEEVARYLGAKNSSAASSLMAILRRIGANVPDVQRGVSKTELAEFREWKAWKAAKEAEKATSPATTPYRWSPNGAHA